MNPLSDLIWADENIDEEDDSFDPQTMKPTCEVDYVSCHDGGSGCGSSSSGFFTAGSFGNGIPCGC